MLSGIAGMFVLAPPPPFFFFLSLDGVTAVADRGRALSLSLAFAFALLFLPPASV